MNEKETSSAADMPPWKAVNPPGPTLFKSRVIRWHSRWELPEAFTVVETRNDDEDHNDDNDDDEQSTTGV